MQFDPAPTLWPTRQPVRDGLRALAITLLLCTGSAHAQAEAQAQVAPAAAAHAAPLRLQFQDFFVQPMGPRGAEITRTLLQAHGQSVQLTGYMVQQERPQLGHFMLTPRPVRMSEHSDGDADDLPAAWAMVYLDASQQDFAVPYQHGLLEVRGVLSVGRLEEQDGRVSWVRLQLEPQATRGMNAQEVDSYLHALQHTH
jgi:hypothetical protein